jgi:hypothetical protein
MVGHAENFFRSEAFYAPLPEFIESLGRSDFMAIQPVSIKLIRAVLDPRNDMAVPNLIK